MKTFNDFLTELNRFEKEKGMDTKTGKPVQKGGSAKKDQYQEILQNIVFKLRIIYHKM